LAEEREEGERLLFDATRDDLISSKVATA